MSRLPVPDFIDDVIRDPRQRGILVAGTLTIVAVGLVPRALSPGLPDAQQALKAQPAVENLFLLLSFISGAALVFGGLVSDLHRRRGLLVVSLVVMCGAGVLTAFINGDTPVYYVSGSVAIVASGVAMAFGIGSVAVAYEGIPRATALGIVYAAFGAATAAATPLLTMFGPFGPRWQAYAVSAVAAAVAIWAAHRWIPRLPGQLPAPRSFLVGATVWLVSILALVTGVIGLIGDRPRTLALVLVVAGLLGLAISSVRARRSRDLLRRLRFEQRPLGAALAVGIAVGFAQAVPLMLLPVVFQWVLGYGALFAILAIAPFAIALLVAGPVSGMLLRRMGPRSMMTVGTLVIGIGDILLAMILGLSGLSDHYVTFIIPLVFIGAGFVVSTTVRTAIVFASTSRGMPGTAAALNETSVSLGSRVGIIVSTTVLTSVALDSLRQTVQGIPDVEAMVDGFYGILLALGTPSFGELVGGASLAQHAANRVAYVDGVQVALVVSGIVAIGGAILAGILIGKKQPLGTVFEMKDER